MKILLDLVTKDMFLALILRIEKALQITYSQIIKIDISI